ncbi:hypothetical protein BDC45DRAFT_13479 [Circinella umbellata]|nr:hypothetical protein BDC45DRAFT_13479 [Circinella umbellata]
MRFFFFLSLFFFFLIEKIINNNKETMTPTPPPIADVNLDGGQCTWCGIYGHKPPTCPLLR